jgi:SAM-dependent methyltransferase
MIKTSRSNPNAAGDVMLKGRQEIQAAYRSDEMASGYIDSRYGRDPFGKALHDRQARLVGHLVSPRTAHRLLEIASGPARLTIYASASESACVVEQSPAMLRQAKTRLDACGLHEWRLVRGDAFRLPMRKGAFDFVMCFKLIRHFSRDERLTLLSEIKRVLMPGGHLLLDVVNASANRWLHEKWGVTTQWIDDYWFSEAEFRAEMRDAGFRVASMYAVHPGLRAQYYTWNHLWRISPVAARFVSRALEVGTDRNPLEWLALCACE